MVKRKRKAMVIGAVLALVPLIALWATYIRPRSIWRTYGAVQTVNGKPEKVKTFQTKDRVYLLDFSRGSGALYVVDLAQRQVFAASKGCFKDVGIALISHDLQPEVGVEIKLNSVKNGWDPELKIGSSELSFVECFGDKPNRHNFTGLRL